MQDTESTKVTSEPKAPDLIARQMKDEDTSEEKIDLPGQEQGKKQEQDPRDIRKKQVLMSLLLKPSQPS